MIGRLRSIAPPLTRVKSKVYISVDYVVLENVMSSAAKQRYGVEPVDTRLVEVDAPFCPHGETW